MALFVSVIRHELTTVVLYGEHRNSTEVILRSVVGVSARMIAEKAAGGITPPSPNCDAARLLLGYLDGSIVDLSSVPVDPGAITPFRSKVLAAARRIPYGAVCSYKELAAMAGVPAAVRAVASVMRRNPLPLLIPCHRVIRSDGSPGAYCNDRCGDDAALKAALLRMELIALKKRADDEP